MADAGEGVEVWRGGVAAWECDQSGGLGARFHFARAMEGLAGLAAELGMAEAFTPAAVSTLAVREHHVRFLQEARCGAPLVMTAGVLSMEEDEARVLQVLRHARTGEPCAAFVARVVHIAVREARPFAWSGRTRQAAQALQVEAPDFAQPRGLPSGPVEITASRERADALAVPVIGRGLVQAGECDVFARMRPDAVMGRCAEAAPHLFDGDLGGGKGAKIGRALLEARVLYPRAATPGARLELRSAPAEIGDKAERFVHWLLDPAEGEAWAVAMTLGTSFDLDARKPAPLPAVERAALQARLAEGMAF